MLYAVSRWLKQWEASGLDGWNDKSRSGRTPVLDESDHQQLQELVAEQPHQIRSLQARFVEETGKTVSTVTLRRALKKISSAPNASGTHLKHCVTRLTSETLKALQQQEDKGEHGLYYFDESGFSQSSSVPYAWSPIGQPCEVTAYSHSRRLNVLGFLSRAGKLIYHTLPGQWPPRRSSKRLTSL